MASGIGRPFRVDLNTLLATKGQFARVCVEVDLARSLIGKIWLEGDCYNVVSSICFSCGIYSHGVLNCPLLAPPPPPPPTHNGDDGDFIGDVQLAQMESNHNSNSNRFAALSGKEDFYGPEMGDFAMGSNLETSNRKKDSSLSRNKGKQIITRHQGPSKPKTSGAIVIGKTRDSFTGPSVMGKDITFKHSLTIHMDHALIKEVAQVMQKTFTSKIKFNPPNLINMDVVPMGEHTSDPPDIEVLASQEEEIIPETIMEATIAGFLSQGDAISISGQWVCSVAYASPVESIKDDLWKHLLEVGDSISLPWLVFRDFNVYLQLSEKRGGVLQYYRAARFQAQVDSCALLDLGFKGQPFTYAGKCHGFFTTHVRLDRDFSNDAWRILFPEALVIHLPRIISDHNPILVKLYNLVPDRRRLDSRILTILKLLRMLGVRFRTQ
ncbi:hypothetical protein K2173_003268 [Erythroxylum novogranatense]|uniref:Reverse transcriptase n=1 Tax=Erythroxylum novogranatense TaxID=1862640 RepID=A0AAV8SYE7_9ROSI|nr:hypothetical protein K2173_003268 [Erythroxylum novogranatense]